MHNFLNKRYYINTNINFHRALNLRKSGKSLSNLQSLNNIKDKLPLLNTSKSNLESERKEKKLKLKIKKKTFFLKSQLKLQKSILEEDKLKKEFFGIIKNKVKDDDDEFNNFLYESHEISNENNKERTNEKYDLNLTKEEKRVFSPYCQIGKDKSNDIDYQIRFRKLFKEEKMIDSDHYNKKLKDIITIQRLFRKLRIKRKLYIGFEEPNYVVRIYEHEYDIYPNIKTVQIIIYSTLFKNNVTIIKSIEELFGVETMEREKIQKKIGVIMDAVIGSKRGGIKRLNDDYYNPDKADLSTDDFNDFEDDDD